MNIAKKYKLASWMMSEKCNFDCLYCHTHSPQREKKLVDVNDLIHVLKKAYPYWVVSMTGGEPFLYPNFIDICKKLVKAGFKIALDTNLSLTPLIRKFATEIPANKVEYIYTSLHVSERERLYGSLDQFIQNVKLLREKKYPISVNYVMHPDLFKRFLKDVQYLETHGVHVEPKPFSGIYKRKLYPLSYTSEQNKLLLSYNPHAFKITTFYSKGLQCYAGATMVRIWPDGTISRCVADKKPIGTTKKGIHLEHGAKVCEVMWCPCFGWDHVSDTVTKDRLKNDMVDTRLTIWETIKTPRIWRKVFIKLKNKGPGALLDYI